MRMKIGGLRTFREAAVVITGGASGIGLALGKELAKRGAAVTIADIDDEALARAAETIRDSGGDVTAAHVDVSQYEEVERLVQETISKRGRIDYLFNNAGIGVMGFTDELTLEHWRLVLDVNLMGVVHGIRAAYPAMLRQGFGHIVNTASVGGLVPFTLVQPYTASKFAIVGLSMALRVEAEGCGVRISALCPGVIDTPLLENRADRVVNFEFTDEQTRKAWARTFPMDADRFARVALGHVARNRPLIIVPGWWRIVWWVYRMFPNFMLFFLKRGFFDVAMKDIGIDPKKRFASEVDNRTQNT